MQASDAGHAIKRLQELASEGPGANPAALTEAKAILSALGSANTTGYLSEKLTATVGSFEMWLSDRRQGEAGGDPQTIRPAVMVDIEKLRKALARGAAGQD